MATKELLTNGGGVGESLRSSMHYELRHQGMVGRTTTTTTKQLRTDTCCEMTPTYVA